MQCLLRLTGCSWRAFSESSLHSFYKSKKSLTLATSPTNFTYLSVWCHISPPVLGARCKMCEVQDRWFISTLCLSSQVLPFPNVALKGDAAQSSTLSFAAASKAIDGRRNSFYSQGFCSHTAGNEANPWWRVDLRKSYFVTSVKVTNRGDCCAERLDGAEIRIGDSLENNGNNNTRSGKPVKMTQCL